MFVGEKHNRLNRSESGTRSNFVNQNLRMTSARGVRALENKLFSCVERLRVNNARERP
jgi:hypothetical protein